MSFPAELPRHLWRFPTRAAILSLAARFDLPYGEGDQDWEYTHSRFEQVPAYLAAYTSGELDDDERFVLMEMIIDRLNGHPEEPEYAPMLRLVEENIELHLATIWYWASTDYIGEDPEFSWEVAPAMREILWRHRELWR